MDDWDDVHEPMHDELEEDIILMMMFFINLQRRILSMIIGLLGSMTRKRRRGGGWEYGGPIYAEFEGRSLRGTKRTCYRHDEGRTNWETDRYPKMIDATFHKLFRMDRASFDALYDKLQASSPHPRNRVRLAVTLNKLAYGTPDSDVGEKFGVPSGSVSSMFWPVLDFIYNVLLPEVMPPITKERLQYSMKTFAAQNKAIPGIVGHHHHHGMCGLAQFLLSSSPVE